MNKILLFGAIVVIGSSANAQTAIDAYRLSQPDLKGTARYMSMAGAFGALGGDLSVLSHNPGGIGVYRNSDVGFTLDLDLQNSESNSGNGFKSSIDQTKFLLNNIGFVWTLKLPSASCPNLNFGFTYNKSASFNRRYRGSMRLSNSLSNYVAAITNGYEVGQLEGDAANGYDPYNPTDGYAAPWLSILGYQGGLIFNNPLPKDSRYYVGEWVPGTTWGTGFFDVEESGGIDSYNIALGGNVSNVLFWGMDFDITHINYNLTPKWREDLYSAQVYTDADRFELMNDSWTLNNYYNCSGTGFNFKLGFIVKPIQELRIGFAFETPTWYGLTETFKGSVVNNDYPGVGAQTNGGIWGYNDVNFRTPWKLNFSAAAVLLNRLIISAEYEWTQFKNMKYSTPSPDPWGMGGYDDPWFGDGYYPGWWDTRAYDNDPFVTNPDTYYYTNQDIKSTYRNTNTLRLGAELRVLPQLSVRAGYSFVSSPVKEEINSDMIATSGTIPNYRFDNTTNYVTCGLGYRIKSFYIDLAYVYKHMSSVYHAFSPYYPSDTEIKNYNLSAIETQTSSLSLNNSQIVLTAGFKF